MNDDSEGDYQRTYVVEEDSFADAMKENIARILFF
jgi:hypothetical protein